MVLQMYFFHNRNIFPYRHSGNTMIMEVQRAKPVLYEQAEHQTPWPGSVVPDSTMDHCPDYDDIHTIDCADMHSIDSRVDINSGINMGMDNQTCGDHTVPQMFTIHDEDENKENSLDQTLYTTMDPEFVSMATSTPLPLLARGHRVCRHGTF